LNEATEDSGLDGGNVEVQGALLKWSADSGLWDGTHLIEESDAPGHYNSHCDLSVPRAEPSASVP
ncbi:MAG: hypothetical protein ACI9DH_001424, partial [Halioglobus sp.]